MAVWTNSSKSSSSFINGVKQLGRVQLLIESTYRLLIGDGYILSIDNQIGSDFSVQSKNSSTFTNLAKN